MKAEVDIKPFLKAIREFRTAEQQPCGVQVVVWVGLVFGMLKNPPDNISYVGSKNRCN